MYKRDRLKKEAKESAEWCGHTLRKFHNMDKHYKVAISSCMFCERIVHIDASPPPNGIEISGDAFNSHCFDISINKEDFQHLL